MHIIIITIIIIIIIIINITGIISCADNTSRLSPSGTTENTTTMVNGMEVAACKAWLQV